jgi:glycosidase
LFKPNQFATFLTNHDQNRVMSTLGDKPEKAKVAATLLLTGPGVPFIYYGEEIGMLGKKPDEDIRLPMQWSAEPNSGFTSGTPWRALNKDWETKNVAAQTGLDGSLLEHYRTLISLRNNHAALRVGDTLVIDSGNKSVYAVLRVSQGETVLVVVNLGKTEVSEYGLSLGKSSLNGTYSAAALLGQGSLETLVVNGQGGFKSYKPLTSLPPLSSFILQLQK